MRFRIWRSEISFGLRWSNGVVGHCFICLGRCIDYSWDNMLFIDFIYLLDEYYNCIIYAQAIYKGGGQPFCDARVCALEEEESVTT